MLPQIGQYHLRDGYREFTRFALRVLDDGAPVLHPGLRPAHPQLTVVSVHVPPPQRGELPEPWTCERTEQDERLVAWLDRVRHREHLVDRERGSFIRLVLPSAFDPARVPADEQIVNRCGEHGMHHPVGLGDSRSIPAYRSAVVSARSRSLSQLAAYRPKVAFPVAGSIHSSRLISALLLAGQFDASAFRSQVCGAGRGLPSGPDTVLATDPRAVAESCPNPVYPPLRRTPHSAS